MAHFSYQDIDLSSYNTYTVGEDYFRVDLANKCKCEPEGEWGMFRCRFFGLVDMDKRINELDGTPSNLTLPLQVHIRPALCEDRIAEFNQVIVPRSARWSLLDLGSKPWTDKELEAMSLGKDTLSRSLGKLHTMKLPCYPPIDTRGQENSSAPKTSHSPLQVDHPFLDDKTMTKLTNLTLLNFSNSSLDTLVQTLSRLATLTKIQLRHFELHIARVTELDSTTTDPEAGKDRVVLPNMVSMIVGNFSEKEIVRFLPYFSLPELNEIEWKSYQWTRPSSKLKEVQDLKKLIRATLPADCQLDNPAHLGKKEVQNAQRKIHSWRYDGDNGRMLFRTCSKSCTQEHGKGTLKWEKWHREGTAKPR